MVIWKTIANLKDDEIELWNMLAREVLGSPLHERRRQSFALARSALRECLHSQGHRLDISELILHEHRCLPKYPQYVLSLSHTETLGAAALCSLTEYRAIGIDIESIGRPVSGQVVDRIRHSEDLPLEPLALWCLKEAAFKALMNTGEFAAPVEFAAIEIGDSHWTMTSYSGEWLLTEVAGHHLALATLRN